MSLRKDDLRGKEEQKVPEENFGYGIKFVNEDVIFCIISRALKQHGVRWKQKQESTSCGGMCRGLYASYSSIFPAVLRGWSPDPTA